MLLEVKSHVWLQNRYNKVLSYLLISHFQFSGMQVLKYVILKVMSLGKVVSKSAKKVSRIIWMAPKCFEVAIQSKWVKPQYHSFFEIRRKILK